MKLFSGIFFVSMLAVQPVFGMEAPDKAPKKAEGEELQAIISIETAYLRAKDVVEDMMTQWEYTSPGIVKTKIKQIEAEIYRLADMDNLQIDIALLKDIIKDHLNNLVVPEVLTSNINQHLPEKNKQEKSTKEIPTNIKRKHEESPSEDAANKKQKTAWNFETLKHAIALLFPKNDPINFSRDRDLYNDFADFIINSTPESLRNIKNAQGTSILDYIADYNNPYIKMIMTGLIECCIARTLDKNEECPICFATREELKEVFPFTFTSLKCLHIICQKCKKDILAKNECPECKKSME